MVQNLAKSATSQAPLGSCDVDATKRQRNGEPQILAWIDNIDYQKNKKIKKKDKVLKLYVKAPLPNQQTQKVCKGHQHLLVWLEWEQVLVFVDQVSAMIVSERNVA